MTSLLISWWLLRPIVCYRYLQKKSRNRSKFDNFFLHARVLFHDTILYWVWENSSYLDPLANAPLIFIYLVEEKWIKYSCCYLDFPMKMRYTFSRSICLVLDPFWPFYSKFNRGVVRFFSFGNTDGFFLYRKKRNPEGIFEKSIRNPKGFLKECLRNL